VNRYEVEGGYILEGFSPRMGDSWFQAYGTDGTLRNPIPVRSMKEAEKLLKGSSSAPIRHGLCDELE
jgi:hypothetical protein